MAKNTWLAGLFCGVAIVATCLLVGLTGGASSPWLVVYAPLVFLLAWFAGPYLGIWSSVGLSLFLAGAVLGIASHLPAWILRRDILSFALIGMSSPLASLRWVKPAFGRRQHIERLEWNQKLADLTQSVCFSDDLNTALDLMIIGLEYVVAAPSRAVFLFDRSNGELRVASASCLPPSFLECAVLTVHQSDTGRCLADGNSVVCLDTSMFGAGPLLEQDPDAGTYVISPLMSLDGLVGAIYLSWPEPDMLDEKDLRRLEEFADSTAFALHRIRTEKEFRSLALTDGLTGLYNYRMLQSRLSEEVARSQREQSPLCFFMLDLDGFKEVNDQHGHPVGDQVLRAVGQGLREACRASDIPVRYGGDEFAVLCPDLSLAAAHRVEGRIRAIVQQCIRRSTDLTLTVSVGTACYPETTQDPENLAEEADRALYQTKSGSKPRVAAR